MTIGGVFRPGNVETISYAGQPVHVLAKTGFGVAEQMVPARFKGPIPHAHDTFDEGLYVLAGELLLTIGDADPVPAGPGSLCLAPRGVRHTFANPGDEPARVLGLWAPGALGLAFLEEVGALIPPGGAPDPAMVAEAYARHHSRLLP